MLFIALKSSQVLHITPNQPQFQLVTPTNQTQTAPTHTDILNHHYHHKKPTPSLIPKLDSVLWYISDDI